MDKSPDVDGCWAYVVACGYFVTRFLVLGMSMSPGILYDVLLDYFEDLPTITAWAINLNSFTTYMSASIASATIKAVGSRWTMVIGCFTSVAGLMITSYALNIIYVLVFYGIITGFGFSLVNIASYPVVATYFEKHRDLVLLLASSGEGFGQFLLPYIFLALGKLYSWRGAIFVIAALDLNFLVIAATFMPPRLYSQEEASIEETENPGTGEDGLVPVSSKTTFSALKVALLDDLVLWRDPSFVILFLSYTLMALGYVGFMTHLKHCALHRNLNEWEASTLLAFLGFFSLLGTAVISLLIKFSTVHILLINAMANVGIGTFGIIFAFVKNKVVIFFVAAIVGFCSGSLAAFPVVVLSVVGTQNLTAGIGYTSMGIAIGCVVGGPIGAALYVVDTTYTLTFLFLGGICGTGALLQLIIFERLGSYFRRETIVRVFSWEPITII